MSSKEPLSRNDFVKVPDTRRDGHLYGRYIKMAQGRAVVEVSEIGGPITRLYAPELVEKVTKADYQEMEQHLIGFRDHAIKILKRKRGRLTPLRDR